MLRAKPRLIRSHASGKSACPEWNKIVIFRSDGYKKNAGKLAEKIFSKVGSAGGHREAARAEVPLKNLDVRDNGFTTDILQQLITEYM